MEFEDLLSKEMPHSVEAEQTILGAMLLDRERLNDLSGRLSPDVFYVTKHKQLFSIMSRLSSLSMDADIVTVLNEAVNEKVFEDENSGRLYLKHLMEEIPSLSNLDSYCRIVEDKYTLRSLITAAREIITDCSENSGEVQDVLDRAEQRMYDIRQGKQSSGLTRVGDVVVPAYDRLYRLSGEDRKKYEGARSGYADLDRVISGLNKTDLIILAARPAMGKTSFALNIATNVCRSDPSKEVVIFSLEMSKEQIVTRMLAAESLVDSGHLMRGEIDSDEWAKLAAGADRISSMNMYLDDTAGINIVQMKSKIRRLRNVGLVVIDYLQLMSSTKRTDNRVNEVSEITRQLKLMAKELNVPVITLSQLSRAVESRTDKRPQLSDLRESGSIEQDADIVMFLYRDGYYNRDSAADVNVAECIVAKNRHGQVGSIPLRWNGQYTLFLAEAHSELNS